MRELNAGNGMRGFVCVVALSLLSLTASGVQAEEKGHFWSKKALSKLNLTEEQKQKLQDIKKQSRSEMKQKRTELREMRGELKKKMAEQADESELKALFEKILTKQNEVRRSAFESMLKVRAILTPEQRKGLMDLAKNKKGRKFGKHRDSEEEERDSDQ